MSGEQEPGGWELMRGINSLKDSFDRLASEMVTQATLALHQQAQAASDARRDERIKTLEEDNVKQREAADRAASEQRKTRQQQWFSIGLAVLASVLALVGGVVLWGIRGA